MGLEAMALTSWGCVLTLPSFFAGIAPPIPTTCSFLQSFQRLVMSNTVPKIEAIEKAQLREVPPFRVGDTVRVHFRIREGEKERTQVFQGVVLRRRRGGVSATFTVRKVSYGVGVERIFPLHSPRIEKLEIVARGHVRQARLYYLRDLKGKKSRLRASKRKGVDETLRDHGATK